MGVLLGPVLRKALTHSALRTAWEKVKDNNGMPGVDGESVDALDPEITNVLQSIRQSVIRGMYQSKPLLRIWIERDGKSPRGLAIPSVRDRILQTSVTMALTPLIESELEDCSYAYRQGRGVRTAVEKINYYQRLGFKWVVEADIETFFDEIPHDQLLTRLEALAPEKALLHLIEMWLTTPIVNREEYLQPSKGVAQGSPISPLLANLYLDTLDDALLDQNHALVRYADDFVILAKTKAQAEQALELTKDVLESLTLKLNPTKTRIINLEDGFEFLGWHFVKSFSIPKRREAPAPQKKKIHTSTPLALEAHNTNITEPSTEPAHESKQESVNHAVLDLPALSPLQKTLYIVDSNTSISVDNQRYRIEREKHEPLIIPAVSVDQIMIFGSAQMTTQAYQLAAKSGCYVALLSYLGQHYGVFEPMSAGLSSIFFAQFEKANDATFGLAIAKTLVIAKLHNSALILTRYQRHKNQSLNYQHVSSRLKELKQKADSAKDMNQLRGYEGAAAALYWQAFSELIPTSWTFNKRLKYPSPDPINALLSLGYSLLYKSVAGLLQARGINPHLGWLHVPGGQHYALASDIMEPYRAYIVDGALLKLLSSNVLAPDDYEIKEGKCFLGKHNIRLFIQAFEARINASVKHPQIDQYMDMRRMIDHTILTLKQSIKTNDHSLLLPPRFR